MKEKVDEDEEECVTKLTIKEFANRITPEEHDKLHLLVSKSPRFTALRAEIHLQLSDPRLGYYLEQLGRFSLSDIQERLKKRGSNVLQERIKAVTAKVTTIFSRATSLTAVGTFVLSFLSSKDIILSVLLSILGGVAAKLVGICITASEEKAERDAQKIADNIEAWLAFHGFPEMSEENFFEIRDRLFSICQDPKYSNEDRKLAAFLLKRRSGCTAKNDNEESCLN